MRNICCLAKPLVIIVLFLFSVNQGGGVKAQSDAFFSYQYYEEDRNLDGISAPPLPTEHGLFDNYQVAEQTPLGNGLLALALLGAGYLTIKSRKNRNKNNKTLLVLLTLILGFNVSATAQNY